jgi:hypothetical protein
VIVEPEIAARARAAVQAMLDLPSPKTPAFFDPAKQEKFVEIVSV